MKLPPDYPSVYEIKPHLERERKQGEKDNFKRGVFALFAKGLNPETISLQEHLLPLLPKTSVNAKLTTRISNLCGMGVKPMLRFYHQQFKEQNKE